jgi:hypothetical protein
MKGKEALTLQDLRARTPARTRERARELELGKTSRGTYQVGSYTVQVAWNGADILVSCTCPNWQWGGPEYHAKRGGYLLGELRGTAQVPEMRDPLGKQAVCKHVVRVIFENLSTGEL